MKSRAPYVAGALTLALYLRTLDFEFTYDDHNHIVKNPFLASLGNLREMLPWRYFSHEIPDQGRPVLLLTHFVDRAFGGSSAVAHLQSALWHALVAALVVVLGKRTGLGDKAAGLAGVLFGLHPALAEAVANVSNREDVLCAAFTLLALLAARRFMKGSRWALAGVVVLDALALGSKELAVVLPLLLVLCAICFRQFRPPRAEAKRRWAALAVAFAVVGAGWGAFQLRLGYPSLLPAAGGTGLQRAELRVTPPLVATLAAFDDGARAKPRVPQGPASARDALAFEGYRALEIALPLRGAPEYDLERFRGPLPALLGALGLALILWLAYRDLRRTRRVTAAVGWFFLGTLPVLWPTLLLNPLADRYLYLPAVGFALLLGHLVADVVPTVIERRNAQWWIGLAIGAVYYVVALANVMVWKNDVSLFSEAVARAPRSARMQQNLGMALIGAGRIDEGRLSLIRATEIDPGLTAAFFNLAVVADQTGHVDEAIERYRQALASHPIVAEKSLRDSACSRLATLLIRSRRDEEARELGRRERESNPDSECARSIEARLGP
jgi:protein O-mannosyl-transferase